MELSKHTQHRNPAYLDWLRRQQCVVSGAKAQCAHHIRLGTNGGAGLKPSDYFCIPLLHEFHATGPQALHIIGEETFLQHFGLEPKELFIQFLKKYLVENFDIYYMLEERSPEETIADLIGLVENKMPKLDRPRKPKKSRPKTEVQIRAKSKAEIEYYEKAKEIKRQRDKELREKLKEREKEAKGNRSKTFKGDPFYERAKEKKRLRDRELRKKLREQAREKARANKSSARIPR